MNHADLLLPACLGESAWSAESMTSPLDTMALWFGETFLPVVDLPAAEKKINGLANKKDR